MGQKVNPNCFNKKNNIYFFNSLFSPNEYSKLFLNIYSLKYVFTKLVEKNNCLVKNCFILINPKQRYLTIYLSVLNLGSRKKKGKRLRVSKKLKKLNFRLKKTIFTYLDSFGLKFNKQFIFHNLNKAFKDTRIQNFEIRRFKREPYYYSSISLLKVLYSSRHNANIMAKFISKF